MPAFTTNQWAILVLVLILGWLLGLASRSGGRKWRRAYEQERTDHAQTRQALDARAAAAEARAAEVERRTPAAPVAAGIGGTAPRRDDLATIHGIGPELAARLNEHGVTSFRDVAALTPSDEDALERRASITSGTIRAERWPEQAALLREGRVDEWRRTFG